VSARRAATAPDSMKVQVAARLRRESLALPQMPWPLRLRAKRGRGTFSPGLAAPEVLLAPMWAAL
jgi:hypothetical protein